MHLFLSSLISSGLHLSLSPPQSFFFFLLSSSCLRKFEQAVAFCAHKSNLKISIFQSIELAICGKEDPKWNIEHLLSKNNRCYQTNNPKKIWNYWGRDLTLRKNRMAWMCSSLLFLDKSFWWKRSFLCVRISLFIFSQKFHILINLAKLMNPSSVTYKASKKNSNIKIYII